MEIKRESLKDGWGEVGSLLIRGGRGGFGLPCLFWWVWLSQLGRLDVRKLPDGGSDIPKTFRSKALTYWAPFTFGGECIILWNKNVQFWTILCQKYSFTSFALTGFFSCLSSLQISQMWTVNISGGNQYLCHTLLLVSVYCVRIDPLTRWDNEMKIKNYCPGTALLVFLDALLNLAQCLILYEMNLR